MSALLLLGALILLACERRLAHLERAEQREYLDDIARCRRGGQRRA